MVRLSGTIEFQAPGAHSGSATVYVRLLDTSIADRDALVIAEHRFQINLGDDPSPAFSLEVPVERIHANRRYEISALVDLDGDGEISVGDFYSTRATIVNPRSSAEHISIPVTRIR